MQITTEIAIADIVEAISDGYGDNDPINFIMAIDESIGDEGFTEDLLLRLVQSYEQEYIKYEEAMTEKALNSAFADGPGPSPSVLERTRSELIDAVSKRKKLSKIATLIRSLNSDSNE
jgi:hypothetical protein